MPFELTGVSFSYSEKAVIDDISMSFAPGMFCGIIGPNGCGKSTLLRVLVEDEEPDNGRVVWSKAASFVHYNEVFEQLDPSDTVTHAVNIVGIAYQAPRC